MEALVNAAAVCATGSPVCATGSPVCVFESAHLTMDSHHIVELHIRPTHAYVGNQTDYVWR